MELKTIQQVKDEVAKTHNFDNWEHLATNMKRPYLKEVENKAIKAYGEHLLEYAAQEACLEQTWTEKIPGIKGDNIRIEVVSKNSILNIKQELK